MNLKVFYLGAALLGTIAPWYFFGSFFAANGLNLVAFVSGVFANGAASGFAADVIISFVVFLIWSFYDAHRHKVRSWWLVLPAGFCVGLSLALPLYLYLRHDRATGSSF